MWILWIPLALFLVVAALLVAYWAIEGWIPGIPAAENLGEVGAAFSAAGVLISGAAFLALVFSMVLQWREIKRQQKALFEQQTVLEDQTRALIETSKAQRESAASLQEQLAHLRARARMDDYDRRLARLVDAQARLDDKTLKVSSDLDIIIAEARARLGHRYWASLTNLLRELARLRDDPASAPHAKDLAKDLRTSLEREKNLLFLAVVPPTVFGNYQPVELGRLMMTLDVLPHITGLESAEGRATTFNKHFSPLRPR